VINLIAYFAKRHLLTNVLYFGLLLLSLFVWKNIGKEEMPEFASNWVRISTIYPGAAAADVELFVTKPMEEELKTLVGIEEVVSTSSVGVSSFRLVLDDYYPDKNAVVNSIKDAILRVKLPAEVRDIPTIRQFKSSEKAILDIGFYHKKHKVLGRASRAELQKYVLSFENQLLALKEISSISRSHYRKPELQILIDPKNKDHAEISLSEIKNQIITNHIRVPVGSMQDRGESKVTALNEYEDVASLQNLIIRANYEGHGVHLGELATIKDGFERSNSIFKVNGHEGVFLNIKKSVSTDILHAQAAVMEFIKKYNQAHLNSPVSIVLMDDESYAVTNRLKIIASNGMIGFALILLVLFLFLDIKTGFWVAMGIPFSMAFTLLIAGILGYTVNNMTLAGIIIVLGIVVDDAIIIAENISRKREAGLSIQEAAIQGAHEVFRPILAAIVTTGVAFLPLVFFEGFFGKLVAFIPLIVILMLLGSLLESLFVLPAHLSGKTPLLDKYSQNLDGPHWFAKYEKKYALFLQVAIKQRVPICLSFLIIFLLALGVFYGKMNYVMFPREESQEVVVKVAVAIGSTRMETASLIDPIEAMVMKNRDDVVAVRSSIGLSRRGGEVKENEASILIELLPADDRKTPLNELLKTWRQQSKNIPGIKSIKFLRGRWGRNSGSPIELQIQENNDQSRAEIAKLLLTEMQKITSLAEVEIAEPLLKKEYLLKIKQEMLVKLNMDPAKLTSALRTFVEGSILYSINKGEEEVDVRLSVPNSAKTNLLGLLELRVENKAGQLIDLKKLLDIEEVERPVNIIRTNYKRSTMLYADIKEGNSITPLQVAEQLERDSFPKISHQYPSAILKFRGEIEDSRESQGEFLSSIILVIIVIYFILVIMFNSLSRPFLILLIVPFGLLGFVFVLVTHGMSVYGFFAVIGALGMIGVVINDAIVMIDKLEQRNLDSTESVREGIARVASSRLRPILITTITTVVGILPTAYGIAGYDSMLAEMMLVMGWGLAFGTFITLILVPCLYSFTKKPLNSMLLRKNLK